MNKKTLSKKEEMNKKDKKNKTEESEDESDDETIEESEEDSDEETVEESESESEEENDDTIPTKVLKLNDEISDDEKEVDEDEDGENEDILIVDIEDEKLEKINVKITKPFFTKYEIIRLLMTRTKQLQLGAKPMIKVDNIDLLTSKEIARLELKHKSIPLIIKRFIPNREAELWHVSELNFIEEFN